MAERFQIFNVTAPAGTVQSAPLRVVTAFNPGVVTQIEIIVPDGHAGLTGIRFLNAGVPVIPFNQTSFITGNDEKVVWPVDGFLDSTDWSVEVFNTDVFDHGWQVRYLLMESQQTGAQTAPIVAPLSVAAIMAAAGA